VAEDRPGLPFPISTAVNIANPFPDIKAQLTGVFGLYTASHMAAGHGVTIFPSLITSMLPTEYGFLGKSTTAGYARSWLKGVHLGGGAKIMDALKIGSDYKAPFMKALRGVVKKTSISTYNPTKFVNDLGLAMKSANIPVAGMAGAIDAGIGTLGKMTVIGSAIGKVALPIMGGLIAGELLSSMAGATFKMGVAAINTMDRISENIRRLEFGEGLGAGYMTSAAKTERQRSVRAIQRSHLNGRRSIGREASLYSEII